jgi:hypothetical protein
VTSHHLCRDVELSPRRRKERRGPRRELGEQEAKLLDKGRGTVSRLKPASDVASDVAGHSMVSERVTPFASAQPASRLIPAAIDSSEMRAGVAV